MRMILRLLLLFSLVITPAFAGNPQQCSDPNLEKEIRNLQQEQFSIKPFDKKKHGDSTLFELQQKYDKLTAQAAILQGIKDMKKRYVDFKKKVRDWDEDNGTSLRDEDFREVLQTVDKGLINMKKMDALKEMLHLMIKKPEADASQREHQHFADVGTYFKYLRDHGCKADEYKGGSICEAISTDDGLMWFAGPVQKMLSGFAKTYGLINPANVDDFSKDPKAQMKRWEIRRDGLKEYLKELNADSETLNKMLGDDIAETAELSEELKERVKKKLAAYKEEYNQKRKQSEIKVKLDDYYNCLTLGEDTANCANILPEMPIAGKDAEDDMKLLHEFSESSQKTEKAAQKALLDKIAENEGETFKHTKDKFEQKLLEMANGLSINSTLGNQEDFFTSFDPSQLDDENPIGKVASKKNAKSRELFINLTNEFFGDVGCSKDVAAFNEEKPKLDNEKLISCFSKINERAIGRKIKNINKELQKVRESILAITGDPNGNYAKLELLKHFLVDTIQVKCKDDKKKSNLQLIYCKNWNTTKEAFEQIELLVNDTGEVISKVNSSLLNKKSQRDNNRAHEFARLGASCHVMLSSGTRVRDKFPRLCSKFQAARSRALRAQDDDKDDDDDDDDDIKVRDYSKNNYVYEDGVMVETSKESNTSMVLSGIVTHGASTGMTYLQAKGKSEAAEAEVPNLTNQVQYNFSLNQAALQYGFDQNGNINFPSTFTTGLNGQPGSTTFFNGFPIFFGGPTVDFTTGLVPLTEILPSSQVPQSYYGF